MYQSLKHLHLLAVATSIVLFSVRGYWMLASPGMLARTWVRVVPHVVDTVLLASAVAMLVVVGWWPQDQPWLMAKILALVAYVVLGSIALKRGRTHRTRALALVAALATFAYIVAVALTKSALGPLALV